MASERTESGETSGRASGSHPATRDEAHSSDPDTLVAEIERTREDLAETLDQIADKVSPKRVAQRSREKVTATVKEKAATAKEVLGEKAATAKEVLGEKAVTARETAVSARDAVSDRLSGGPDVVAPAEPVLPPVDGVEVPVLSPRPVAPAHAAGSPVPAWASLPAGVPKEVLVGAGAALLGLWLLWRRRS